MNYDAAKEDQPAGEVLLRGPQIFSGYHKQVGRPLLRCCALPALWCSCTCAPACGDRGVLHAQRPPHPAVCASHRHPPSAPWQLAGMQSLLSLPGSRAAACVMLRQAACAGLPWWP